jgi:hypothetical protein
VVEVLRVLHPEPTLLLVLSMVVCVNIYVWVQWLVFKNEFMSTGIAAVKNKLSIS